MPQNAMTDIHMTLFCLVDGEATSNAFSVKSLSSDTVDDLKDAIKTKKALRFDDVAADELTLWRVSIPIADDNDDDDEEEDDLPILLNNIPKSDKKRLKAVANKVSEVFDTTPGEKVIRVIVQRPSPQEFPGWQSPASVQPYIDQIKEQLLDDESKEMMDALILPTAVNMLHERLTGRFRPIVTGNPLMMIRDNVNE
ncbi:hypothetical protein FBU30_001845 [Linnemannia zychae]|nr:hypothetical protein FBU30_001845 [Linnemannia zychae]